MNYRLLLLLALSVSLTGCHSLYKNVTTYSEDEKINGLQKISTHAETLSLSGDGSTCTLRTEELEGGGVTSQNILTGADRVVPQKISRRTVKTEELDLKECKLIAASRQVSARLGGCPVKSLEVVSQAEKKVWVSLTSDCMCLTVTKEIHERFFSSDTDTASLEIGEGDPDVCADLMPADQRAEFKSAVAEALKD